MPTNPNMVAIQTVTVGAGGAANITFSNIPQTYTDLVIALSARSNRSGDVYDVAYVSFNGSTTGYSGIYLEGNGSSAASYNSFPQIFGGAPAANATANTFGNSTAYIPNYTSANNKSWSVDIASENNATAGFNGAFAGLWSNSAAITSIAITPRVGSLWNQYSTATLYGVTSAGYGAKATGGIITQDENYFYHTFLSSGTFTPTSNITADYLVVAGGGGGGAGRGGGGGAGGMRCTVTATGGGGSLESALSLTASTNYTVTVGAGGAGRPNTGGAGGAKGSDSVFSTITSSGGGLGGDASFENDRNGGSGGGNAAFNPGGAGTGTANQGFAGGIGNDNVPNYPAGGGGGAGAVGQNAPNSTTAGNGGNGVATSISGSSVTYAGGGGGSAFDSGFTPGNGGTGGGGNGAAASSTTPIAGGNGSANTGGGGGGGNRPTSPAAAGGGGNGGSGIVIVRYAR